MAEPAGPACRPEAATLAPEPKQGAPAARIVHRIRARPRIQARADHGYPLKGALLWSRQRSIGPDRLGDKGLPPGPLSSALSRRRSGRSA